MKFNRNIIAAAVALALFKPTAPALAQDAGATEELDEVIVSGIRASLDKSLDVKRRLAPGSRDRRGGGQTTGA
jgi:iron complex outermembrane receptor protein